MAVLEFRFDESWNRRFMSVGGWIGEEGEWKRLETSWQRHIDRCNHKNKPDQRISRAHASHMHKFKNEFEKWNQPMADKFQRKLIGFLAKRSMVAITMGVDVDALITTFPDMKSTKEKHWRAYTLCIKFTMNEIGKLMARQRPDDQVHLVHDHGSWDVQALETFNFMVDDKRWKYRKIFTGITPLTGKQSVGLQAADLIVYEAHKAIKDRVVGDTDELSETVQAFLEKKVPVIGKYLDHETVVALSEELDRARGKKITAIK